jgi:hypothetical protein
LGGAFACGVGVVAVCCVSVVVVEVVSVGVGRVVGRRLRLFRVSRAERVDELAVRC